MLSALLSGEKIDFITVLVYVLSSLAVIFLTLPIHEFAHAFTADKLGDPTPRYQRRLTLNPFAHIDYFGALCILLFGYGWAKPVQVNAYNFKNSKTGMALVALAGPLSNLVLAFVSGLLLNVAVLLLYNTGLTLFFYLMLFFRYIAQINVYLAVFNLIPVPPLDGSRILGVILSSKTYFKIMQYERYIYIILMALLFTGALDVPLDIISGSVMKFIMNLSQLPFNLLV